MEELAISLFVFITVAAISWMKFGKLVQVKASPLSKNDTQKWAVENQPHSGGIGLFLAFVVSFCFAFFFARDFFLNPLEMMGLISASSAGFALGLYDDKKNIAPFKKLIGQVCCGVLLFFFHWEIAWFSSDILNLLTTVFWVVLMMNSTNMLDNMDGICVNTALIAILFFGIEIFFYNNGNTDLGLILLGVAASLLVFTRFNKHPSKMFMGDSGSQYLGVLLAALGIKFGFNNTLGELDVTGNVVLTLLILWVALNDTLLVTTQRLIHGISPFVGGRDHSTHNLAYLGMNDHNVMLVFRTFGLINVGLSCLLLNKYCSVAFCLYYLATTFVVTTLIAALNLKRKKYSYS